MRLQLDPVARQPVCITPTDRVDDRCCFVFSLRYVRLSDRLFQQMADLIFLFCLIFNNTSAVSVRRPARPQACGSRASFGLPLRSSCDPLGGYSCE